MARGCQGPRPDHPLPCSAGAGHLDLTQEGAAWGRGPSKEEQSLDPRTGRADASEGPAAQ